MLLQDSHIAALAWLALLVHLGVAGAVIQRRQGAGWLAVLNTGVALLLLVYWAPAVRRWLVDGFRGDGADLLFPLYGVALVAVGVRVRAGRDPGALLHWVIFGLHVAALLAIALFASFFRMDRLF